MMELSCDIVRDLLPLVHDGVASEASRAAVQAHLAGCSACRAEWEALEADAPKEKANLEEAEMLRGTARAWKKSRLASFFKGAFLVSLLACIACTLAYNLIGSYVAADGTLVEPFGFIPLAWLFALMSVLFGVCGRIAESVKRKK